MAKKKKEVAVQVGVNSTVDTIARAMSAKSVGEDGKATLTVGKAIEFIKLFEEVVAEELKQGKRVQLTGFLTITPSYRNEREGNNVFTGQKMTIPASVTFNAKVGKSLKDIAKELPEEVMTALKEAKDAEKAEK